MKIYKLLTNQFDISVVMTIYTNIGSNSSAVSPKETRDVYTHTHTHTLDPYLLKLLNLLVIWLML